MKNHIIFKFIAVFLATLTLFFALASGFGITALTALGLYEESVDELYKDQTASKRQNLAVNLVHRYASLNLGQLPEYYLDSYYGTNWMYDTFQYGYYYYTIKDEHGNVVETTADDLPSGAEQYRIQVTEVNYRTMVDTVPWGEEFYGNDEVTLKETEAPAPETGVTSPSVPEDTTPNTSIPVETTFAPATEVTEVPAFTQPEAATETEAAAATETKAADESFDATQPAMAAEEWHQVTEAVADYPEAIRFDEYYDYDQGEQMQIMYTIQELPPYTVELYLLPGAMPEEHIWSLLRTAWDYRNELFYVFGFSLLGFAICAVYLCCAAGKKPGREEVRAGGFNSLPLDLYLGGGGFLICLVIVFGVEVVEYLLRYSPNVLVPFVAIAGFGCCFVFVGFCFACAAQFKTPGYYWARNSITGRCFSLVGKLWSWLLVAAAWLWKRIPPCVLWCFRKLWLLCLWLYNLVKKILLILWTWLKKGSLWLGDKLGRIYSLLPLTWQWMLTGFIMIFLLAMTVSSYHAEMVLIGVGLTLAIVLYGASSFGILLEGAKRMSKGDLETKVSDQFLIGSFKDFAEELNALANVAVVAAQKQMKSERMKTELITNVSHDIKTPLTSIINYVDLLQKPHSDEEQEMYLEVLSRQSQQLKKLIEDLMEMSKASTGNMNVEISSVNAAEAINQALGEFSDKLERAQLIPVFRQPEEPVYMLADGRLAWRVMSNLLSNAVKYALPGTRVYIDLMELEGKVIISMKNISREELNVSADELLERFVRGDASRNTEGSGLGLNIAQSLMEIQKGQLQLLVDGDLFKVTMVFPAATI